MRKDLIYTFNKEELKKETLIEKLKGHPEIVFHIIGDGSKLEECKELANDFNLKNITFYGRRPVSEMPNFYGMADAMLITLKDNKALSYTLPGKVQSYLAAGKPIVGAINGETRQVIEDADCGLCCDAEDYKSLSQLALDFCKSDKGEEMATNSKKFYLENYSKSKFIESLERELVNLEAKAHV